jgi:AsmA protein
MTRPLYKVVAWLAIGLAAACVLALLALRLLVDPNEHKQQIQAAFREATGRDLDVQGPLALSVFPTLALTTDDAAIGNRPGFEEEPFARLGHARMQVRLWPLLASRRLEFGPMEVEQLDLNLAVAADGTNNWSDLFERLPRKPAAAPGSGGPRTEPARTFELSIASLELHEARVSFRDEQSGAHYVVSDIEVETGHLRPGEPVDLRAQLALSRNGRDVGRVQVETQLEALPDGVVTLTGTAGEILLTRKQGAATPVALSAPRVEVRTATGDLDLPLLEAGAGGAIVRTSLHSSHGRDGRELRGSFTVPATNPRDLLRALRVEAPQTRDPKTLHRFAARGELFYSGPRGVRLDSLKVTLDETRLEGRLAVTDVERGALRFDLRGDALDVDRYLGRKQKAPAAAGRPGAQRRVAAPLRALRQLDVRGHASLDRLRIAGVDLQDVDVGLRANDGRIFIDPFRAGAFGGRASSSLTVDVRGDVPAVHLEQQLEDVDVAAMLGQLINLRQLSGRGHAQFVMETQGSNADALFRGLRGTFDMTVEDGALLGADLGYEIERALGAAQLRQPTATNTGRTDFRTLRGRGTLSERTLRNQQLEFVSDVATVRGRGAVDYGRNHVDLDLTARLLKLPPGRMFGIKLSRVENVAIPVEVTGPIDAPKVRPDVSSLLQAVAKSSLQDPVEDKVKKSLKDLLGF